MTPPSTDGFRADVEKGQHLYTRDVVITNPTQNRRDEGLHPILCAPFKYTYEAMTPMTPCNVPHVLCGQEST